MQTSKAIAGAAGAAVGASPIGQAVADIVYWLFQKTAFLADVPQGALEVLAIAAVTYAFVYFAPKNREA